jgi:DNA-binding transcriptional LysR family regulator
MIAGAINRATELNRIQVPGGYQQATMDRLTSMRVFDRIAALRSFSGAARELGISQATASKHIQTLEEWLGARLFDRTTRRVDLTEFGVGFYAQCSRILQDIDDARRLRGTTARPAQGTIRLAASTAYGSVVLGRALAEFAAKNPGIAVDVVLTDRAVNLIEEGFDVALQLGMSPAAGEAVQVFAPIPAILAASPDYLATVDPIRVPSDLTRCACLTEPMLLGDQWTLRGARDDETVLVSGPFRSTCLLVLREAAIAGAGILAAPAFLVEDPIGAGLLKPVLPHFALNPVYLSAIPASGRHDVGKIRAMLSFLQGRHGIAPEPRGTVAMPGRAGLHGAYLRP